MMEYDASKLRDRLDFLIELVIGVAGTIYAFVMYYFLTVQWSVGKSTAFWGSFALYILWSWGVRRYREKQFKGES